MLSKEIENALNDQIAKEGYASQLYLSMASWCDKSGYSGAATFLYDHAEEERGHMLRLFKYITEAGGHAQLSEIAKPQGEFKTLVEVFEQVFAHEKKVTESINKLVELCLSEKDYSSFNFLQWYVSEQHEEEFLFQSILDKIKLLGDSEKRIFWIDREIGRFKSSASKN